MFDSGSRRSETSGRFQNTAKWAAKDRRAQLSRRGSSSILTRNVRTSSSDGQIAGMMQAADSGHRYEAREGVPRSRCS